MLVIYKDTQHCLSFTLKLYKTYISILGQLYTPTKTQKHKNNNNKWKQQQKQQQTNKSVFCFFPEPDEVNNVTVSNITKTSVQVTWDIPSLNPGPVNYTAVAEDNVLGNSLLNKMCSEQGEELLP